MADNILNVTFDKVFNKIDEVFNPSGSWKDTPLLDKFYAVGNFYKENVPSYMKGNNFTWQQLLDYINNGYPEAQVQFNSGEQYRSFVKKRNKKITKSISKLKEIKTILSEANIKDVKGNVVKGSESEQKAEIAESPNTTPPLAFDTEHYQKLTQIRDYWNIIRVEERSIARLDSLKAMIKDTVSHINALPKMTETTKSTTNYDSAKEAILLLSDLHIGIYYDSYNNVYNEKVAGERLNHLAAQVVNYCKFMDVGKLNIVNLGDMIEGIIHTNARIKSQYDAVTQTMVAGELVAQFINYILDSMSTNFHLVYRSCLDNHSRLSANKDEAIDEENLSRVIDWYIKERLAKEYSNIEFPDDNLDMGLGRFKLDNSKTVMFAHGHQDPVNMALQNMVGATREFVDYILLGHYHSSKQKTFQGCTILVNGSIVGTDNYANSRRLFSDPAQKLVIFDNNNLIDIDIKLN